MSIPAMAKPIADDEWDEFSGKRVAEDFRLESLDPERSGSNPDA